MTILADIFIDIFALSFGFWLILCFYNIVRVQRFIVKRYEQESELLSTIAFKEHATFTRYLPEFFSSALYTGHLLICLWGWRVCKGKKCFKDIKDSSFITRNFSYKEIRKVKGVGISGLVVLLHLFAFYVLRLLCPEKFF